MIQKVTILLDITISMTHLMGTTWVINIWKEIYMLPVKEPFLCYQIPFLGWGRGSGSDDLYQAHLKLVNQSVCHNLLRPIFDPDVMICAGDVENGGRDVCYVRLIDHKVLSSIYPAMNYLLFSYHSCVW